MTDLLRTIANVCESLNINLHQLTRENLSQQANMHQNRELMSTMDVVTLIGIDLYGKRLIREVNIGQESIFLSMYQLSAIDLAPLTQCTKLKKLYLDNNNLFQIDLAPLAQCTLLETLDLHTNKLSEVDLTPLVHCKELRGFGIDSSVKLLISQDIRKQKLPPALETRRNKITWTEPRDSIKQLRQISLSCETLSLAELAKSLDFKSTSALKTWLLREAVGKVAFKLRKNSVDFSQIISDSPSINRTSFFCVLDSEAHPATEAAYQCKKCIRFVCSACYELMVMTEVANCPYCGAELTKVQ